MKACLRPRSTGVRRGFKLVELMIVVAIIGLLLSLLLPALQAAREAARESQCKNHLRKIGRACLAHENTFHTFPHGGWSFLWMGDPDQGAGPQQPGGWIYAVVPYLDEESIARIGAGLPWQEKKQALAQQIAHVVPSFNCPSRRPAVALDGYSPEGYPVDGGKYPKNAVLPEKVAKTDYAINGGPFPIPATTGGTGGVPSESCLAPGGGLGGGMPHGNYPNCDWHCAGTCAQRVQDLFSGISTWRLGAQLSQIVDGTDKTILAGDKSVPPTFYDTSSGLFPNPSNFSKYNPGDNGFMYSGYDYDETRWEKPILDSDQIMELLTHHTRFGSAHPDGANFVFCNGAVRTIDYDVDDLVWVRYVGRDND